jgi:hypothetical protein
LTAKFDNLSSERVPRISTDDQTCCLKFKTNVCGGRFWNAELTRNLIGCDSKSFFTKEFENCGCTSHRRNELW